MKLTKLQKEIIYEGGICRITTEITINVEDLANFDYGGIDMIPDECIPDILVAVGRMYKGRIKKGKILDSRVKS